MRRGFIRAQTEETVKEKVLDIYAGMQGVLSFKDPVNLRINGKFEGELDTKGTLVIGEGAEIIAEISGEYITVAGKVKGNIKATKGLKLIPPAFITGDLETPTLSISEGAVINGNIRIGATRDTGSTKKMLTLDEVAKYLNVDKALISEWVNSGKLAGVKDNNLWTFDKSVVDNWISNAKVD